ncbi:MAG: hypothetical protein AB4057_20485 [Crocosphaera sp.]
MSKRISITLSDEIISELEIWAQQRGQTLAGLASHLVEKAVTEAQINTIKLSEQTSSDLRKLAQQKGLTPAAFAQKILIQGLTSELREGS